MNLLDIEMIRQARERLQGIITYNPLAFAPRLSKLTNTQVFLKKENLQLTGAFKIRGAFNKLASLKSADECNGTNVLQQGVICASAGNHAQGVAYSAQHFGVRSVIVMPEATPLLKVSGTKAMGAEVVLAGNNYDEAYEQALQIAKKQNLHFIHPFADSDVIAGQGTIALEMIGVQSKGANAMTKSFLQKQIQNAKSVRTIADGIAVRDVDREVFECVLQGVSDIVEVDEEEIASTILFLLENQKLVVEGAGAASVAAIMHKKIPLDSTMRVGAVLSGGNIDVTMLNMIIEKGLFKSHRKMKIEVVLIDKPGSMQKLSDILSHSGANIVQITYDRTPSNLEYGDVLISMGLEIKGLEHKQDILTNLKNEGYEFNEII